MKVNDFTLWYKRNSYDMHGGQTKCANALGVTTRQVQYLLDGREPNATLNILCKTIDKLAHAEAVNRALMEGA